MANRNAVKGGWAEELPVPDQLFALSTSSVKVIDVPLTFAIFSFPSHSYFARGRITIFSEPGAPNDQPAVRPLFPNFAQRIKLGKLISVIGYYSCVCVRIAPATATPWPLLLLLRVLGGTSTFGIVLCGWQRLLAGLWWVFCGRLFIQEPILKLRRIIRWSSCIKDELNGRQTQTNVNALRLILATSFLCFNQYRNTISAPKLLVICCNQGESKWKIIFWTSLNVFVDRSSFSSSSPVYKSLLFHSVQFIRSRAWYVLKLADRHHNSSRRSPEIILCTMVLLFMRVIKMNFCNAFRNPFELSPPLYNEALLFLRNVSLLWPELLFGTVIVLHRVIFPCRFRIERRNNEIAIAASQPMEFYLNYHLQYLIPSFICNLSVLFKLCTDSELAQPSTLRPESNQPVQCTIAGSFWLGFSAMQTYRNNHKMLVNFSILQSSHPTL